MILIDKLNKLKPPDSKDINAFSVDIIKKDSNHLIGINCLNEIAILFDTKEPKSKGDSLKYIELKHNQYCLVIEKNKKENKSFSVLKCSIENSRLKEVFLKLLENIVLETPNQPSQNDISEKTRDIFDLFEKISKPSRESLIGLWGELFVINSSKDIENLVKAWHPENNDIFDFYDHNEALEIKTTTTNNRVHNFSFEQLNIKNEKLIVGSILLRYSRSGKSLENLRSEIYKSLKNKDLKQKLDLIYHATVGDISNEDLNEFKYDYFYASENIKYYKLINIPRLVEKPMHGVNKIKFQSDFTGIKSSKDFKSNPFYNKLFISS